MRHQPINRAAEGIPGWAVLSSASCRNKLNKQLQSITIYCCGPTRKCSVLFVSFCCDATATHTIARVGRASYARMNAHGLRSGRLLAHRASRSLTACRPLRPSNSRGAHRAAMAPAALPNGSDASRRVLVWDVMDTIVWVRLGLPCAS